MEASIKSHAKVKVNNIHCLHLFHRPFFFVGGNQVGQTQFSFGKSMTTFSLAFFSLVSPGMCTKRTSSIIFLGLSRMTVLLQTEAWNTEVGY